MRMSTWMWLAAVAVLAGCSFEPPALQPGGDGGLPPPPPPMDAPPPDAAFDAAPPDAPRDTDGDTVADPDDNCPMMANPDQADCDRDALGDACDLDPSNGPDEDEDGFANGCDNCPSELNPTQADILDDDGVGDDCDPRPTEGGDSIAFFEGFDIDSDGPPQGWTLAMGNGLADADWQVEAGKLRVPAGLAQASILFLEAVDLPDDIMVETLGSGQDALAAQNAVASTGVVARYTNDAANGDTGISCVLEQPIDETSPAAVRLRNLASAASQATNATWRAERGTSYRIVHVQHGADSRCTARPVTVAALPAAEIVASDPGVPASGRLGLRVLRNEIEIDHVVVYGLGGPLPAP